jgi:hypothetical protein
MYTRSHTTTIGLEAKEANKSNFIKYVPYEKSNLRCLYFTKISIV